MEILKQSFGFISTISVISITDNHYEVRSYKQLYHNKIYSPDKIREFARFSYIELKRTIFEGNI